MRRLVSLLAALCLMASPAISMAEVASLAETSFSVETPAGMVVVKEVANEETGVGVIEFAVSEDAPVLFTFRSAPLSEEQGNDLAAMDDAGRLAFVEAVLGVYDDAEVSAATMPDGSDAVQLTAADGRLFAILWTSGGRSLTCYATSTDNALTDADRTTVTTMLETAVG